MRDGYNFMSPNLAHSLPHLSLSDNVVPTVPWPDPGELVTGAHNDILQPTIKIFFLTAESLRCLTRPLRGDPEALAPVSLVSSHSEPAFINTTDMGARSRPSSTRARIHYEPSQKR